MVSGLSAFIPMIESMPACCCIMRVCPMCRALLAHIRHGFSATSRLVTHCCLALTHPRLRPMTQHMHPNLVEGMHNYYP